MLRTTTLGVIVLVSLNRMPPPHACCAALCCAAAGGLVGVAEFAVLPQVGSGATALWTLAAMAPCLAYLW